MIFGSVCSGIEAASAAWEPLGWKASFLSEIAPAPRAVLKHHYPDTPLRGDFTEIQRVDHDPIELLVGGTPCQSFSVAGLRRGMADERGNLALEYLRLADRLRPRWLVWENVPGVLSSNGGRDFGSLLGGLRQLGYCGCYRVLDAQYIGVPQRRRRVFLVGYLGDWRRAAAVLLEPASLRGDPPPRREEGERTSPTLSARASAGGGLGTDHDLNGGLIEAADTARCLTAKKGYRSDGESETFIATVDTSPALRAQSQASHRADSEAYVAHTLRGEGFDASEDGTGRRTPLVPVAFDCKASGRNGFGVGEIASTQRAMGHSDSHQNGGGHQAVMAGAAVRRLTPRECERLQDFPDDYTLVPYRGRMMADGPRYQMLGNSMARCVMVWLGRRIQMVESMA
ncbi:DNA cytosine methyltransferase [Pararoseomonas indoligenes]|uniref:DNA cytosine methyltransferase n=1 Tax=Roseomonas indoligenes TaxID=2820811 RepID=UPI0031582CE6